MIKLHDYDSNHENAELVLKVLEPIWITKTQTAKRLRGQIAHVLSWSANKTDPYRPKGPNPAAWHDNLEHKLLKPGKLTKTEHRPALPWQDIREFMAALRRDIAIAARALEFAILTGMRTDEVRLAPWSEINLTKRIWQIPAPRMKSDRPHRVPLSDAAIQVLLTVKAATTPDRNDLIFPLPTGRPLGEKAMRRACHRINPAVSVHGMRSTLRDWLAEETKFPRELAELAIAHAVKGETEAAYWRTDALEKRRPMMEAWGRFCIPQTTAKVIPFTAA